MVRESFNLDEWVQFTAECKYLPELDMRKLLDMVSDVLVEEPNIVPVKSPVTICGDIHGQYYDLEELFRTGGPLPSTSYIFMGDFVDRGYFSLETFTRLVAFKVKFPDRITLIRGNHESRQITKTYGFYDECLNKYGNATAWRLCCKVFDLLPIAAIVDNSIFCVHGGLSPYLRLLDGIETLQRENEIPTKGPMCDLMWSDPEDGIESWAHSPRGAGWLFGKNVCDQFCMDNNVKLIARAHQLVQEGYKYLWDKKLLTVWSAPNYCYRCGNIASILRVEPDGSQDIKIFSAVKDEKRVVPEKKICPYFL